MEKTLKSLPSKKAWEDFNNGDWQNEIDVRDFIQKNFKQYDGDESFLENSTKATNELNQKLVNLKMKEREAGGVLEADTKVVSTITSLGQVI